MGDKAAKIEMMEDETSSGNISKRFPYCGHHYFNPQWMIYEGAPPALLYSNAVYFTVSHDGTHYFHQTYSGPFYASQPAVAVAASPQPCDDDETDTRGHNGADYSDEEEREYESATREDEEFIENYDWDSSKCQLPVKPCLNPWQQHNQSDYHYNHAPPLNPQQPPRHRKKRDVRSTVVPMFPSVFSLKKERSNCF